MDLNSKIQGLSRIEKHWYNLFDSYCKRENTQVATSVEIQMELMIESNAQSGMYPTTKELTSNLKKLRDKGILGMFHWADDPTGWCVFYYSNISLNQAKKLHSEHIVRKNNKEY